MFRKSKLQSKKFAKRKRQFLLLKVFVGAFLFFLLFFGFYKAVHLPRLAISGVKVEGSAIASSEEIEKYVKQKLEGKYYYFFPKHDLYIYPEMEIRSGLLNEWAGIESVKMKTDDQNILHVEVEEKKPEYLWCGEYASGQKLRDCYFLDHDGLIFSKSPEFSGTVYITFFGESLGGKVGVQFLPKEEFHALTSFFTYLKSAGIAPQKIIVKGKGEYEMYLKDGKRILFSNGGKFEKTALNLITVLESETFKKEVKSSPVPLEYIDIRFDNKIFYKFEDLPESVPLL